MIASRLMTGDDFIKLGFWSQLVLLFLVDWGTLVAFDKADHVPLWQWASFITANLILLTATWYLWKWLKPARGRDVVSEDDDAT